MELETPLRDYLEGQRDAVPSNPGSLTDVMARGRRRLTRRRTITASAGALALVAATVAGTVIFSGHQATAMSPLTGTELTVLSNDPVILQGQLAPQPAQMPQGTDLTFTPITRPTADDLAALELVITSESYTDPIIVALGEIQAFDLHVYAIHDLDPETHSGRSVLVAIGPDYPPELHWYGGPTERAKWGPSGNWAPDHGAGEIIMRLPDTASYAVVEVNDSVMWQRPSDGFVWIPYSSIDPPTRFVQAAYDATGRELFRNEEDDPFAGLPLLPPLP